MADDNPIAAVPPFRPAMLDFGRGGNELVETARLHGEELRKQRETVAETLAALMGKDPWSGRRVLALIDERIGELER